ncbi:MAG: hypothetical protein ACRC3B_14260, partial [Bacteroidia bacterium]
FPWALLVLGSLIKTVLKLVRSRFRPGYMPEMLSAGGFVLIFLAMSASKYKLPHYIYITFPFAALMAARFFIHDVFLARKRWLFFSTAVLHVIFYLGISTVVLLLLFFSFPDASVLTIGIAFIWLLAGILMVWKLNFPPSRMLYPLLCALLAGYFVANVHFYPHLLSYQATSVAGKEIARMGLKQDQYYYYNDLFQFPGDAYSGFAVNYIYRNNGQLDSALAAKKNIWILTDDAGYNELKAANYQMPVLKRMDDYPVQFLKAEFLNPEKRASVLRNRYLIQLGPVLVK